MILKDSVITELLFEFVISKIKKMCKTNLAILKSKL